MSLLPSFTDICIVIYTRTKTEKVFMQILTWPNSGFIHILVYLHQIKKVHMASIQIIPLTIQDKYDH